MVASFRFDMHGLLLVSIIIIFGDVPGRTTGDDTASSCRHLKTMNFVGTEIEKNSLCIHNQLAVPCVIRNRGTSLARTISLQRSPRHSLLALIWKQMNNPVLHRMVCELRTSFFGCGIRSDASRSCTFTADLISKTLQLRVPFRHTTDVHLFTEKVHGKCIEDDSTIN